MYSRMVGVFVYGDSRKSEITVDAEFSEEEISGLFQLYCEIEVINYLITLFYGKFNRRVKFSVS